MPTVNCWNCGGELERPPHKIESNDRHFCDQECYHEFGRADLRGENSPQYKGGKVSLTCECCGGEFQVYPFREDSARFCSRECKDDHMAGRSGADTPAYKGAKETYTCQNCGDEFEEYPYREFTKYCSRSCYREASKELFAGDANPVWRGGYEPYYGPNWDEQRREAIERDGHECQDCGTHADDMDRSPDVHHKKRLGWYKEEYDRPEWWERGNALDNLVTLCPSCHREREWSENRQ
jgi:5-methylcytosine-specific restriction endonuclease McrA